MQYDDFFLCADFWVDGLFVDFQSIGMGKKKVMLPAHEVDLTAVKYENEQIDGQCSQFLLLGLSLVIFSVYLQSNRWAFLVEISCNLIEVLNETLQFLAAHADKLVVLDHHVGVDMEFPSCPY